MVDIAELKRDWPLPRLMEKLGHGERAKRKAFCPFHNDVHKQSFSVWQNGEWHWKCWVGCGSGDEISFIQKFFDLPDFKSALARYADIAGNPIYDEVRKFQGKIEPRKVAQELPKPIKPAKLEPLSLTAAYKIGNWRGLDPYFLMKMSAEGIIGLYDNKPAFVTEGGVQYRVPNDGWRFSAGAKNSLLILGEPAKDKLLAIVESNWDALAYYADTSEPVICTRGAANARIAIDYINTMSGGESMDVEAIPHNDKPGEDWANDLRAGLMLHDFRIARVSSPHKDFAALYKHNKTYIKANGI